MNSARGNAGVIVAIQVFQPLMIRLSIFLAEMVRTILTLTMDAPDIFHFEKYASHNFSQCHLGTCLMMELSILSAMRPIL